MAGIGFELKKLFGHRGALATLRAYGYAGIVCTGPMLMSIGLLVGLRVLSTLTGADHHTQDLLVSMVTYCLLGSLVLTSSLSMVTTRFTADMLYEERTNEVLPSFYGSLVLQLGVGAIGFIIFLLFSGVSVWYQALCLVLFCEFIIVWTQINYLTAIKDYRSILIYFASGVVTAMLVGAVGLFLLKLDTISVLMCAVILGYGVMMSGFFVLLHRYFPRCKSSSFSFLGWIDKYPALLFVGIFLGAGLFGHLVITWTGPLGVQVEGLFYGAPQYDIPAIMAFLSLLVTTINFTVSVEVNFYPWYKQFISLFNAGGALSDIEMAETEMLQVLRREMVYLAYRQFVVTVLFIVVGTTILVSSGLGMTEAMLGTYRVLCVGYGLYAVANSIMLIQLYFSDNTGAFWSALVFAIASIGGTIGFLFADTVYYGFGFLIGGALMYLVAWLRLWRYTKKLQHHTLSSQPVLLQAANGPFTRLGNFLNRHSESVNDQRQWKLIARFRQQRRAVGARTNRRGTGLTK